MTTGAAVHCALAEICEGLQRFTGMHVWTSGGGTCVLLLPSFLK